MKKILFFIASVLTLYSCEDVVDVDLDNGPPQLVVDAWMNDLDRTQIVNLRTSAPYFDNESELYVADANVRFISSTGGDYTMTYVGKGNYIIPADSANILIGNEYTLRVEWEGSVYEAVSSVRPVPPIDSITYSRENVVFGDADQDSIWIAQFWATDLVGVGDSYWVRSFKNDTLLDNNITLAFDAGTARGSRTDSVPFILPVRFGINPDGDDVDFFQENDTIKVELFSISSDAFDFWQILQGQLNNGGLFATPPVNTPTNIVKISGDGLEALGWFETSAGSRLTRVLDPAQASPSQF